MVDRDLLVRRDVHAHVDGEEVEHLALRLVLGRELLRGDLHRGRRLDDLDVVLAAHESRRLR